MIATPLFEEPPAALGFSADLERLGVKGGPAWPDRLGDALRAHFSASPPISTLSLFAGGGGLDIGFHDVGFHASEAVEIEPKYAASLDANNGVGGLLEGTTVRCIDIRHYEASREAGTRFVIGGPPCQTFSAAGRRASGVTGTTDERGMLFEQYVRLLSELEPDGFLFENVYGITGAQNGEAWRQIVQAFRDLGFVISHRVLDAADYGAPQHRERMIIVGTRKEPFAFPRPTHGPDSCDGNPFYTAGEAVDGAPHEGVPGAVGGRFGHLLPEVPPGLNYSFFTKEMGHPRPIFAWRSKFSDLLYKADPERPVKTIKAHCGQFTGPFHWENRGFSTAELKRLQTFPDRYELVGGARAAAEQIGNSVPPQLARMLALAVREQVFGDHSPIELDYLKPTDTLGFRKRKRTLTDHYKQLAAEAIARLPENEAPGKIAVRSLKWRVLTEDFGWRDGRADDPKVIRVEIDSRPEHLSVNVCKTGAQVRLSVLPNPAVGWPLDISRAELVAEASPLSITAAWKAFEEEVLDRYGFADLVQASGYYVYDQKITAQVIDAPSSTPSWQLLRSVTEGRGVGVTAPLGTLAEIWGLDLDEVALHGLLRDLRGWGYEVRSSRTNPQIPSGEYLVPYAFPTFTPRSVQRSKSL
jgi:DNA (cytosine-5)-methyltransferase 1